jgi:hypothetical protein
MTVNKENDNDNPMQESCVGPFWVIDGDRVIGKAHRLTSAEIEDRKKGLPDRTPSHHDIWPNLRKPASASGRTYMTIPRGRVVYEPIKDEFVIYLAPEIYRDSSACDAVVDFSRLYGKRLRWVSDDHHYATQDDLIDEGDDFPDL